ncbi:hypothetical protein AZL_b00830 (plasmid) [Azospirillum sp. B510]|uniref:hypothetical protein n=1 Tax=Azospirillum sp. (strain B510) TaxID=137722 RepID=UPI0001C4CA36|nr:hypothetical protein [Azospirillum sp. B510]BAI74746.1 hypothetical protein AZL_b00830 [Azospirillum sp. B510]
MNIFSGNAMARLRRATGRLALSAAIGLGGCATERTALQPRDPLESEALQLVRAADLLGLRDADAPVAGQAPGGGANLPAAAMFGGLNYLSPPPGFTSVAAGALGFASLFFSGPAPEDASRYSQLLIWMPRGEAATEEEAWRKLNEMVQRELAAVLAEVALPPDYRLEKEESQFRGYRPGGLMQTRYTSTRTAWRIHGGECDEPKVTCQYQVSLLLPPVERPAPALLGGYPAWTYVRTEGLTGISPSFIDRRPFQDVRRATFPDMEVLRKLSARLPAWVAIYVAPRTMAYRHEETGEPALLGYPVILRSGTIHYFVKNRPPG